MKNIRRIKLNNFQIHKNLEIDLINGLNVLVGDNNSGKSSIVRAIYWCLTNKPKGDWMRPMSDNGKLLTTDVTIHFDDTNTIRRVKGNGVNRYYFNEEKFDNFGNDIPKPIEDYIGQLTIRLGSSELTPFITIEEGQLFVVGESGPTKGALLNYLTGVEFIDRAKDKVSKNSRELKKELKDVTKNLNHHIKIAEFCETLPSVEKIVQSIEQKEKRRTKLKSDLKDLQRLFKSYRKSNESIQLLDNAVKNVDMKRIEKLINIRSSMQQTLSNLIHYRKFCESIDMVEHKISIVDIDFDYDNFQNYRKMSSILMSYKDICVDCENIKNEIKQNKKKIKSLGKIICSECGQEIRKAV